MFVIKSEFNNIQPTNELKTHTNFNRGFTIQSIIEKYFRNVRFNFRINWLAMVNVVWFG